MLFSFSQRHIDGVVDEAVLILNNISWRRDHFTEGIYHTAETIGTHYELYFINDRLAKKRVTLFRPQAPVISVHQEFVSDNQLFNLILPLYQRADTFKLFLANFENLIGRLSYKIFLTIVYFGNSVKELMTVFQPFLIKHRYRSYHIEHVTNRTFSRGYALDIGIQHWKGRGDPLLFLCDVDVIFNEEFLNRCQRYTEKQNRVYYPVVFSLYNPEVSDS